MQYDTGQEYDVIKYGRYLEIIGQQPADLKNMLMQPAFNLAKEQDEQPQTKDQGEEIQVFQITFP